MGGQVNFREFEIPVRRIARTTYLATGFRLGSELLIRSKLASQGPTQNGFKISPLEPKIIMR